MAVRRTVMFAARVTPAEHAAWKEKAAAAGVSTLDDALGLRPDYIEHQLDAGDGGTDGGGWFAFGTALEPVGHRRFGGC